MVHQWASVFFCAQVATSIAGRGLDIKDPNVDIPVLHRAHVFRFTYFSSHAVCNAVAINAFWISLQTPTRCVRTSTWLSTMIHQRQMWCLTSAVWRCVACALSLHLLCIISLQQALPGAKFEAARGIKGDCVLWPWQDGQDYVHRIGRTGRAGRKGKAITLLRKGGAQISNSLKCVAFIGRVVNCTVPCCTTLSV